MKTAKKTTGNSSNVISLLKHKFSKRYESNSETVTAGRNSLSAPFTLIELLVEVNSVFVCKFA